MTLFARYIASLLGVVLADSEFICNFGACLAARVMVYMLTQDATLFAKADQERAGERQTVARHERKQTIINVYQTIGTIYGGQVVGVQESRS